MAFKKTEYDPGDVVTFDYKRKPCEGVVVKRKRIRSGWSYIIARNGGGLIGPFTNAHITNCIQSGDRNNDVGTR